MMLFGVVSTCDLIRRNGNVFLTFLFIRHQSSVFNISSLRLKERKIKLSRVYSYKYQISLFNYALSYRFQNILGWSTFFVLE